MDFTLPGMYEHHKLNLTFLLFYNKYPAMFLDNVTINSIYGNFYYCSWDGGRIFSNKAHTTKEEIEKIKNLYNNTFNMPMRFIFTNPLLSQEDCYDRFNNTIMSMCHNGKNEVVVNSPILEEYLRNNYPNYKFISSTTKCLNDKQQQKEELSNSNYYMVCLDYNHNKDIEFLQTLSTEEKNKAELLVNALCPGNCPMRKQHYQLNGEYSLNMGKSYSLSNCNIIGSSLNPDYVRKLKTTISPEDLKSIYEPMGFSHFKLEGRTLSGIEVLCQYVKYLIKPEYQLIAITLIMQTLPNVTLDNITNISFEIKGEPIYGKN